MVHAGFCRDTYDDRDRSGAAGLDAIMQPDAILACRQPCVMQAYVSAVRSEGGERVGS